MNYQPSQNDNVNDYIEDLDGGIKPLFLSIRATVLEAGPDFNESIKWKDCLVYGTSRNHIQTVVGKGKISLIFHMGASLNDAHGFLEGDGKKTRTMRITSLDYDANALADYVHQTLALG